VNYPETLSAAWRDARAARQPDAPTVVSTFAGCGGSSLGYAMAGFRELLAVEWDAHAVEMYRRNFPGVDVFAGDIAEFDPRSAMREHDLSRGDLDVLDGSPPCQGFSVSGRQNLDDPRNQLFREFVRVLDGFAPKVFVMENVAALAVQQKFKGTLREIFAALRGCGYRVDAKLLIAHHLGVPQSRRRVIFVGVRDDLEPASAFPSPLRTPVVTTRAAIADLIDDFGSIIPMGRKIKQLAVMMPPGKHGGDVLGSMGKRRSYFNTARLDWDEPSRTLTKMIYAGSNELSGGGGLVHPVGWRLVGSRELARLQSFPDEYDWAESSYPQIVARLGNSVPPLMMREIAQTIRNDILEVETRGQTIGRGRRRATA
jgi:DNA (cytosine-5)-methyltransferase 1